MKMQFVNEADWQSSQAIKVASRELRSALKAANQNIPSLLIEKGDIENPEAYRISGDGKRMIISAGGLRGAVYGIAWLADRVACGKLAEAATDKLQEPDMLIRYAKTTAAMYDVRKPLYEYGKNGWMEQMDIADAPYVSGEMDVAVMRFRKLCDKLLLQRYNGIIISDNIHMVTLDSLKIHSRRDPSRLRAIQYRKYYREMIDYAASLGMDIVVYSDEIMATKKAVEWIGRKCPRNPRVWKFLRAKYREMLDAYPEITGVMLRMGEHRTHMDYEGFMLRSHRCKHCHELLESDIHRMTAEAILAELGPSQKLFYRTWIALGDTIHSDPDKYRQTFGPVEDKRLVPTIKNTSTDFWLTSPLNRTFGVGGLDQMAEFDCHRDMDGLQAVPSILTNRYRSRVAALKKKGVTGVWAWPCESGAPAVGVRRFLNASTGTSTDAAPKKYDYPVTYFNSFTKWTQANVYLLARYAWKASTPADEALTDWACANFGDAGNALANGLMKTEAIVSRLMYTQSYNKAIGEWSCNMPNPQQSIITRYPYGWIVFTNDMNVNSLLLDIYKACKPNLDEEINAGWKSVRGLKELFAEIKQLSDKFSRPADAKAILKALRHSVALGELVAAYRESYLRYYKVAEMLHGPIWAERKPKPGRFKQRKIIPAEESWPHELQLAKDAIVKLEAALKEYRSKYNVFVTDQVDGYLEMAKGFINVVWLE